MKYILLSLLIAASVNAEDMVKKYNGVYMSVSKATPNIYYLRLQGKTYAEKPEDAEKLHDADSTECIQGEKGKSFYEISAKGGVLTHKAIDCLVGQRELRKLNLANNKTIDDEACKKISAYLPRLRNLNLYGTSVSDKGLTYLLDLQELRTLHLFDTKVSWNAANKFRAKMQSISGNDDLEVTIGHGAPPLGSIKHGEILRASYQKNTEAGKLNIEKEKAASNNKYEEDLKKETTDPVLDNETP